MNDSLTSLFPAAPLEMIPTAKAEMPYKVLKMLANGKQLDRQELTKLLGETWRSGLQSLRGDRYGHWLIHTVKKPNNRVTNLQLDPRHFSDDPNQDAAARRERKKNLKKDSCKQALHESKRLAKAIRELTEAQKEYLLGLGDAANDEDTKKPHS